MADLMFLHPRDLVTIYDQKCENPEQQRSHVVGCEEVNDIAVMSDFYTFLAKKGIAPEAIRSVSHGAGLPTDVLMENSQNREFYVTCFAGEIHRLRIVWSEQWRVENGYSELPFEARAI